MTSSRPPTIQKSRSRTPQGARLSIATIRGRKVGSKRTAYRLALGLGDPQITVNDPFVIYLVNRTAAIAYQFCRADDEIFALQRRLAELQVERERLRGYLKNGSDSIGDILAQREPLTTFLIPYIKRHCVLTDYVEERATLDYTADWCAAKCPLPQHQGPAKLQLHLNTFSCAGCGIVSGDVIEFIRRANNLSFAEALRRLRKDVLLKSRTERTRDSPYLEPPEPLMP